jgi:hypothetical protein
VVPVEVTAERQRAALKRAMAVFMMGSVVECPLFGAPML